MTDDLIYDESGRPIGSAGPLREEFRTSPRTAEGGQEAVGWISTYALTRLRDGRAVLTDLVPTSGQPAYPVPLYLAAPAPSPEGISEGEVEAAWRDLVEKSDRTSPEEYPDTALITYDELAGYLRASRPSSPSLSDVERETKKNGGGLNTSATRPLISPSAPRTGWLSYKAKNT